MTIAQQLNIKEFPFEMKDSKGNRIYYETSYEYWERCEYDSNGNISYSESSHGWTKYEYDSNGKEIYYENSNGYWEKREYDTNGKEIYYETSDGDIEDNRPKTDVQKAIELLEKEGLLVDGKVIKN